MSACISCGRELPGSDFAFCPFCGAAADSARTGAREQRKVVTVLFADLVGSTELGATLDPEVLRGVMQSYWGTARTAIEQHGGSVAKFIGDAVVGVFGVPLAREDDAVRALRAAADLVADVQALAGTTTVRAGVELSVRVGVNTGSALIDLSGGDVGLMVGDVANMGARLEEAASPGSVLVGEATAGLARHAADLELLPPLMVKGRSTPLTAYRLVSVHSVAGSIRHRRFAGRLVGRKRHLQRAAISLETVLEERSCAVVTVIGDAGVGKSRLVDDFLAEAGDQVTVLSGRALPYGDGIAYWPLAQALRCLDVDGRPSWGDVLAMDPLTHAVTAGLETITGRAEAADATQIAFAFRHYLTALSRIRPVALVLDDLQWADPAVLGILESLTELSRGTPLLLVCMARPEFLAEHPTWGVGRLNATTIVLSPLGEEDSRTLLSDLLAADVPTALTDQIIQASEGNPLFLEEVVADLVERGHLVESGGRWHATGPIDSVPIPLSVQSVLAARLDRLPPLCRRTIEVASVVGQVFYPEAIAKASDDDPAAALPDLVRLDLIRPEPSDIPGLEAYAFCHQTMQAAAYEAMPFSQRQRVHLAVSQWLDQHAEDRSTSDLATYHLARSAHYASELGTLDEQTAAAAIERLRESAFRTVHIEPTPSTLALLDSALELAHGLPQVESQLLLDRARVLWSGTGGIEQTSAAVDAAQDSARRSGATIIGLRADVLKGQVELETEPGLDIGALQARLNDARERLSSLGERDGVAEALVLLSMTQHGSADPTTALRTADQALDAIRGSRDPLAWAAVVDARLSPYMSGPRPLSEEWAAIAQVRAALADAGWDDDPRVTPHLAIAEQRALARAGRIEEATHRAQESWSYFDERRLLPMQFAVSRYLTEMYWYVGDVAAAQHWSQVGLELQRTMGSTSGVAQRLALLASLHALAGSTDLAAQALEERSGIPDANDCPISRAIAPAAEGLVQALRRHPDGAHEQLGMAEARLSEINLGNARSIVLLLQSLALERVGDHQGAARSAEECLALAEWLEWVPAIEQARARVDDCRARLA